MQQEAVKIATAARLIMPFLAQWLQQVLKPKPKMLVFIVYNGNLSHSDHDSVIEIVI